MSEGTKWQQLYDEAIAEKDMMKGLERIAKAREAIKKWLDVTSEHGTAEDAAAKQHPKKKIA